MPEVRNFLTISTAHVTRLTAEWLDTNPSNLGVYGGSLEYGWFLWVPTIDVLEDIPEELLNVFKFARKHDCAYVMFDRDGPIEPELQSWDW